jgi:hypothetical protein
MKEYSYCDGCLTYELVKEEKRKGESDSRCLAELSPGCHCADCLVKPTCRAKNTCMKFVKQVILTFPNRGTVEGFVDKSPLKEQLIEERVWPII